MTSTTTQMRDPLDGFQYEGPSGLIIRPFPDHARFSLQCSDKNRAAASRILGRPLPESVSAMWGDPADLECLCLGPGEWQLTLPENRVSELKQRFDRARSGFPHSLVDISHRQAGIRIEGPGAAICLQSGCPLDLENRPDGWCTRTLLSRVAITLIRTASDRFRIEVSLSQAPFAMEWLMTAARQQAAIARLQAGGKK